MEKDVRRVMEELIEKLSEAAKAYYVDAKEIMTNYEYDALYDRLEALEKETGIILAGKGCAGPKSVGHIQVDMRRMRLRTGAFSEIVH